MTEKKTEIKACFMCKHFSPRSLGDSSDPWGWCEVHNAWLMKNDYSENFERKDTKDENP